MPSSAARIVTLALDHTRAGLDSESAFTMAASAVSCAPAALEQARNVFETALARPVLRRAFELHSDDERAAQVAWAEIKGRSMVQIEYTRRLALQRWSVEPGDRWWLWTDRIDADGNALVDGQLVPNTHYRIADRIDVEDTNG